MAGLVFVVVVLVVVGFQEGGTTTETLAGFVFVVVVGFTEGGTTTEMSVVVVVVFPEDALQRRR